MSDKPDDEFDIEKEAKEIVRESLEMGDKGPITSVEGECERCGDDAVRRDPVTDELLCEEHSKEFFRERHG